MKIIIDAMGGDNAPLEIVKGALSAHSRFGCDIVLTGDVNDDPDQHIQLCISAPVGDVDVEI